MGNEASLGLKTAVPPIVFSGKFTPALREYFRTKRQALGITYRQLGEILHINWSTIRKWESGTSQSCHANYISRIAGFLSGEFDDRLKNLAEPHEKLATLWNRLPRSMHECFERAATVYGLCENHPELCDQLKIHMFNAINAAIHELLQRSELH